MSPGRLVECWAKVDDLMRAGRERIRMALTGSPESHQRSESQIHGAQSM